MSTPLQILSRFPVVSTRTWEDAAKCATDHAPLQKCLRLQALLIQRHYPATENVRIKTSLSLELLSYFLKDYCAIALFVFMFVLTPHGRSDHLIQEVSRKREQNRLKFKDFIW